MSNSTMTAPPTGRGSPARPFLHTAAVFLALSLLLVLAGWLAEYPLCYACAALAALGCFGSLANWVHHAPQSSRLIRSLESARAYLADQEPAEPRKG
jgi:hypothetical protein